MFAAIITFLFLLAISRGNWTEPGKFGRANSLTAFRLISVFFLAQYGMALDYPVIVAVGLLILILDGVDGWLAKRSREVSEFGAYFDKETDAFFMLILCLLLVFKSMAWSWIMILGLMRYLFGIFLFIFPGEIKTERRSQMGRIIYVIVVAVLLAAFLPLPIITRPLIIIATGLLAYSFGRDIVWILRQH